MKLPIMFYIPYIHHLTSELWTYAFTRRVSMFTYCKVTGYKMVPCDCFDFFRLSFEHLKSLAVLFTTPI